mmetsp:Transcript_22229/g.56335  ORF Transcript_22229/g.56335 Transcript_22229/m.56335 type:complete len:240 (-) Transcript_22229:467-1186(-)
MHHSAPQSSHAHTTPPACFIVHADVRSLRLPQAHRLRTQTASSASPTQAPLHSLLATPHPTPAPPTATLPAHRLDPGSLWPAISSQHSCQKSYLPPLSGAGKSRAGAAPNTRQKQRSHTCHHLRNGPSFYRAPARYYSCSRSGILTNSSSRFASASHDQSSFWSNAPCCAAAATSACVTAQICASVGAEESGEVEPLVLRLVTMEAKAEASLATGCEGCFKAVSEVVSERSLSSSSREK